MQTIGFVSIQLIAPASGALGVGTAVAGVLLQPGFHSTDCPSEWGQAIEDQKVADLTEQFPFN